MAILYAIIGTTSLHEGAFLRIDVDGKIRIFRDFLEISANRPQSARKQGLCFPDAAAGTRDSGEPRTFATTFPPDMRLMSLHLPGRTMEAPFRPATLAFHPPNERPEESI